MTISVFPRSGASATWYTTKRSTQGRSRTEIISQFVEYAYEKLAAEGVYVAADVFGAIIGGGVDSDNVGQSYGDMAASLDYICP